MGKTFKSGHSFPEGFGFHSSGKVRVAGHARAKPKKMADGGLVTVKASDDVAVETGFAGKKLRSGYAKGGPAKKGKSVPAFNRKPKC